MNKILLTSIAAALCALPALAEEKVERHTSSSYATVNTDGKGNGKAIVTIEVDGKKETREIDLGGNTQIKISASGSSDDAKALKGEKVVYLGVAPEELSPVVAAQLPEEAASGVLATAVMPDSPAAAAGLLKNDVIVRVDDQAITDPKQLKTMIAGRKEGDSVRISYFRRGQKAEATAKLATRVESESSDIKIKGLRGGPDIQWQKMLQGLGAGLSIDKEVIVVDKDGNVVSRDKKEVSDKIERELARLRDQLATAQSQAADALKRAEEAARAAAEAARKSLEKP